MTGYCAAATALAAILSACAPFADDADGDVAQGEPIAEGFFGAAAGDDPRSVLAAREALARGGSAADAATAYFFMAAVSAPSTSSLAAGGVCMNYDAEDNETKLLDFRGPAPAANAAADLPTAAPGAVRGLFLLHAETGVLAWPDLAAPAERAARFGVPVSRSLARGLALAGDALVEDPEARKIFARPDGSALGEGDALVQLDLAGVLSSIRTRGAGDFYVGRAARRFSEAARAAGTALAFEDMRAAAPAWRETYRAGVEHGVLGAEAIVHAPGPGFDSGATALAAFGMLRGGDALAEATADGSADHLAAEVALRAAAARALRPGAEPDPAQGEALMAGYSPSRATAPEDLPAAPAAPKENPAASRVAAVDAFGNAAACAFTLNGLFGNGRVAPGTGVLLSQAPGGERGDGRSLLPVVVVNEAAREVIFAGVATGGAVSAPVMARVLAELFGGGGDLRGAIARPRVFHPGEPHVVFVEASAGRDAADELVRRGHEARVAPDFGRIDAVFCPEGLRNGSESCEAATDPRAFGLAVGG